MGKLALAAFVAALVLCMALGWPVLCALLTGLAVFPAYALYRGHPPAKVLRLLWQGVRKAGTVHIMFLLIGVLTALWRASGTIPYIVGLGLGVIHPDMFLLSAFLVCCAMSMLTGTCFGTVGTIGAICMVMARTGGVDPAMTAGAVLSGSFFGDRMSPMSSTAHLVCGMTGTNIYRNIRNMLPTTLLPFLLSAAGYLVLSRRSPFRQHTGGAGLGFEALFRLSPLLLLPAAVLLLLCVLRVNVRRTMLASIGAATLLCLLVQGMSPAQIAATAIWGYRTGAEEAAILDGGGVMSMLGAMLIVLVSSSYYAVFAETDLLDGLRRMTGWLAARLERFTALALTGLALSVFCCSQALAVMLTCQLCDNLYTDKEQLAHDLEDSLGTIPPLIPWCVAAAVPLATLKVGAGSLFYAFFLYLTPLCRIAWGALNRSRRPQKARCAG